VVCHKDEQKSVAKQNSYHVSDFSFKYDSGVLLLYKFLPVWQIKFFVTHADQMKNNNASYCHNVIQLLLFL